ncbi:MAG: hypothetical protein LBS79_06100, partial [Tannerella sp.]|nr:hypothetical protein [Tannerella sp.]
NYTAVTGLRIGTYTITELPTPVIQYLVTLDVSPYFLSDPQSGSFYVESMHDLTFTLTPLPTLPAGYEPKVTTNRLLYPDDKGGVEVTRNDGGTWTVRIAYILEETEVTVEAVDPLSATGNEDIPAGARVWSSDRRLYVAAGATDGRAYIYNMTGVLMRILPYTAGETVFTTLPAGIYIVVTEGGRYKIFIAG